MMRWLDLKRGALVLLLGSILVGQANAEDRLGKDLEEQILTPLPQREVILPIADCVSLVRTPMDDVEGSPFVVSDARLQTMEDVEYCHVAGMVAPQVQFELKLPTKTYQGRYLAGGCGGACGAINDRITPVCSDRHAKAGSFAVSFNNSGHVGPTAVDTAWAAGAPQLQIDFAYRATHVTALAAKQIIAHFYGSAPDHSYFVGCSNGGREALMSVQRYPDDFDGVLSGAPAIWISSRVLRILWESRTNDDGEGNQILTPESTRILHHAVLAACDGLDGLEDGQLDRPRACQFDPFTLVCKDGQNSSCITERQAEVMRKFYEGPVDDQGRHLYLGGYPYGSELLWAGEGSLTALGERLVVPQVRNLIYGGREVLPADWSEWELDADFLRDVTRAGGFYQANDPYIQDFRDKGGKLILWQGLADPSAGPSALLDYYQRVRNALGGIRETNMFLKAYLAPGVYHCRGGYIAYQFDLLGPLVHWVERNVAPEEVASMAILEDGKQRTRPLYPYPAIAQYDGSGDPDAAENFRKGLPEAPPNDLFEWVAQDMIGGRAPLEH